MGRPVRRSGDVRVLRMKIAYGMRALVMIALGVALIVVAVCWNWLTWRLAQNTLFDGSGYCPVIPDGVEVTGGGVYSGFLPPSITCDLSGYVIESGSEWEQTLVTHSIGAAWPFWIGVALMCGGYITGIASMIVPLVARGPHRT